MKACSRSRPSLARLAHLCALSPLKRRRRTSQQAACPGSFRRAASAQQASTAEWMRSQEQVLPRRRCSRSRPRHAPQRMTAWLLASHLFDGLAPRRHTSLERHWRREHWRHEAVHPRHDLVGLRAASGVLTIYSDGNMPASFRLVVRASRMGVSLLQYKRTDGSPRV